MKDGLPTLFVSIASWRDPECQHTVRDLFEKAAHPERIHVGIVWQFDPKRDGDCFEVPSPYPYQTQSVSCLPRESKGGCWARAKALAIAQGEDYILQIDSHMRFVPGWDDRLIETLSRCKGTKAALTATLPRYWPPNRFEEFDGHVPVSFVREANGMRDLQPIATGGYKRLRERLQCEGPVPTPLVVANFLFGRAAMFAEVPYDPHLYFRGQEACYSLRLWTHGYSLYHPDSVVAYHYWDAVTRLNPEDGELDYKTDNANARAAQQRVWHVLGLKESHDPKALQEIEKYGHGTVRRAADFWDYAGIDLATGAISEKAHFGFWPEIT